MHLHVTVIVMVMLALAVAANAAIHTEAVPYTDGGVKLIGYLAYDDTVTEKRPAVLVVPEWWGLNDYAKRRARELAELGYVALAVDMYGQGKTTTDPKQAGQWAGEVRKDLNLMRQRAAKALDLVKQDPRVDAQHVGAIGYCFGGGVVLELARSGAAVEVVVSFHGTVTTQQPAEKGRIKARVLICNGADDTAVSPQDRAALQQEMDAAGADWTWIDFAHAVHAFTNPAADGSFNKNVKYDEKADKRSWAIMKLWLAEALGR
ncbi:MAG: dienelactone hydrolase family protein [Phycisphaeraceae bacterium]